MSYFRERNAHVENGLLLPTKCTRTKWTWSRTWDCHETRQLTIIFYRNVRCSSLKQTIFMLKIQSLQFILINLSAGQMLYKKVPKYIIVLERNINKMKDSLNQSQHYNQSFQIIADLTNNPTKTKPFFTPHKASPKYHQNINKQIKMSNPIEQPFQKPTIKIPTKQQQIFLTCYFCYQSEQQCQSDILIDSKCWIYHACYKCFLLNKNQSMSKCDCKLKLKDHLKIKNSRKQNILDEGVKFYEKQLKVRNTWQDLDNEFSDLLAYFSRNGRGNEYAAKERQLKIILKDLKKKENLIFDDLKKMKIPQLINRQNNDPTGKQACGYESNYEKGIKILFESFGL